MTHTHTHTKDLELPARVSVRTHRCMCECTACITISSSQQSQMSHSSADSRSSMSHNDRLMMALCFFSTHKGTSISFFLCDRMPRTHTHKKYKLTNTLTHKEFGNLHTHKHIQWRIQRKDRRTQCSWVKIGEKKNLYV